MFAMSALRVISHRCLGFGLPENSASALRAALISAVDEVEVDFRVTRDGKLVASHFDLFFDAHGFPRLVSRTNQSSYQQHALMPLEECLALFAELGQGKRLRIEVKSQGVEQQVFDEINRRGLLEQVVVVSWSADSLRRFRVLSARIELSLSYIMGLHGVGILPFALPTELPLAINDSSLGIRSVNIIRGVVGLSPQHATSLLSRGVEVYVTSSGGEEDIAKLQSLGVTGALCSSMDGVKLVARKLSVG
jgi:glycerophosphoryl diester phosphodiesterase